MTILACDGTLKHFWLLRSEQEVTGTDRQLNSSQPGLWSHTLRALGSRQRLGTFLREHSVTIWVSQSLEIYHLQIQMNLLSILYNNTSILSWVLSIQLHIQHVVEIIPGDSHGGDVLLTLSALSVSF